MSPYYQDDAVTRSAAALLADWERASARIRRLETAISAALSELGVPDEHYPSPVANAVLLLKSAQVSP